LMEIKKIDMEVFSKIEDQIWVDSDLLRKININQVEVEELKSHPYISWNVANSITKMRLQKGSFTKLEEILESALIDRELFEKIKPYLSL
jgi:competence protein ComEA